MEHVVTPFTPAFQEAGGTLAFSDEFQRIVSKSSVLSSDIRVATAEETLQALDLARATLPIAAETVVKAVYAHNPE